MRTNLRHFFVALIVLVGLGVSFLSGLAYGGNLNCATRQCVAVSFADDGFQRNINCWLTAYIGQQYAGKAYSTAYAGVDGYGTDSIGGAAGNPVNGFYYTISNANSDCTQVITPVSGTTGTYSTGTTNATYNTTCGAGQGSPTH